MSYELEFDKRALKEWYKLDASIRNQLKKKLVKVLEAPIVEANRLRSLPNCFRIKLRKAGYRLVYQVEEERVVVFVIAVGKRDRAKVYQTVEERV